jgi:hypothetical protein
VRLVQINTEEFQLVLATVTLHAIHGSAAHHGRLRLTGTVIDVVDRCLAAPRRPQRCCRARFRSRLFSSKSRSTQSFSSVPIEEPSTP